VARIDPTARVADGARIADSVEIGPFCTVGAAVELRDGVRLISHVCVDGVTTIGARTVVHPFAVLGGTPQSVGYKGEPTRLTIGADCMIRECVTMSVGTADGRGVTAVGDRGFFMAYSHIAHDCQIGSDVTFANGVTLGGHVAVGDFTFIGGLSAVHQFVRIGPNVMIGGMAGQSDDVIPFGITQGNFAKLRGINLVGMRRRKYSAAAIRAVRAAYRRLFFGDGNMTERLQAVEQEFGGEAAVAQIIAFIRSDRDRELCRPDIRSKAEAE
jgi:UDP-N-acetylglucosamine acyltransferase